MKPHPRVTRREPWTIKTTLGWATKCLDFQTHLMCLAAYDGRFIFCRPICSQRCYFCGAIDLFDLFHIFLIVKVRTTRIINRFALVAHQRIRRTRIYIIETNYLGSAYWSRTSVDSPLAEAIASKAPIIRSFSDIVWFNSRSAERHWNNLLKWQRIVMLVFFQSS